MEEFKESPSTGERARNLMARCKDFFALFFRKVADNKRKIGVLLIAVLVVGAIGASSMYAFNWWKFRNESSTFSSIRKGELAGTSAVGSKFIMGDLEITVQDVAEGSYRPLELDAQGKRITRNYLSAKIMIFNTGYKNKDFLLFGLEDGKGGQYERDTEVEFYMKELKDFGPAREIYPRTIREGHLNFQAPDADIQNLQLIILDETTNKKVIFDIER